MLTQSVFSRLTGYADVNDADRLCCTPVMRQLVGGWAVKCGAASAIAVGLFRMQILMRPPRTYWFLWICRGTGSEWCMT